MFDIYIFVSQKDTKRTCLIRKLYSFVFFLTFLFSFSSARTEKDTIPVNQKKSFKTKRFEELNTIINNQKLNYKPQTSEFTNEYLKKKYAPDSTTIVDKLKAIAVIADLDESGNYVDVVSPDELISFPVGVKKQIGNLTYTMAISKAKITPEYTEVTAFVKILTPQKDSLGHQKQLFFGTDKLKLSHRFRFCFLTLCFSLGCSDPIFSNLSFIIKCSSTFC